MVHDTVKGTTMGIEPAPYPGYADASALHAGIDQGLRHSDSPRTIHWPEFRHPIITGVLVGNDDRLSTIRRQNHRGVFQLREKTTVRSGTARLLQREVQISAVYAKRDKDAIEPSLGRVLPHPLPAPIALR